MPLSSLGVSATEQENVGVTSVGVSPHKEAFRAVTFASAVCKCAEDDTMSPGIGEGCSIGGSS